MSMLGSHVLQHPTHIQHIFLQNITKMYTCLLVKTEESEDFESALTLTRSIQEKLAAFLQSSNLEVQERVSILILIILIFLIRISSRLLVLQHC